MPKVSVCIPAFNHLDLFKRCLGSVLSQNFRDYEIIVSDDSSTQDIGDYLKSLHHPRLHYFYNSAPLGSPLNWNKAMAAAQGQYIKLLHHDDYLTGPQSLSAFVQALDSDPAAGMAFCYSKIIYKSDDSSYLHRQSPTQLKRLAKDPDFLFFRNVIGAPSAVIHRNDPSFFYDWNYQWLVDVEFYMRFLARYPRFVALPQALVTVVAGESGQITETVSKNRQRVIQENLDLFAVIYKSALHNIKAMQYFEELFEQHQIGSFEDLTKDFRVAPLLKQFMQEVFEEGGRNVALKKIRKRLLTSRYNKMFFQIERF